MAKKQSLIIDDVPQHQLMQVLRDTADQVEETTYYKPLTQEELDVKREEYFDNQIKLASYADELADIKSDYKEKMKPLQSVNAVLLDEVKTRQTKITGTLFHLANHETGFMETYNETGELIATRRLRPDEKQKNIFSLPKKAVNE